MFICRFILQLDRNLDFYHFVEINIRIFIEFKCFFSSKIDLGNLVGILKKIRRKKKIILLEENIEGIVYFKSPAFK